ncbi:MAG: hypothetical protein U0U46_03250 [Saprospiraceae bacterium]
MNSLEKLEKKLDAKISADIEAEKSDRSNYKHAILMGILFAGYRGVISFIIAFVLFEIIKVCRVVICTLFTAEHGKNLPPLKWGYVFYFLITILGIFIGWSEGYNENRTTRKNETG